MKTWGCKWSCLCGAGKQYITQKSDTVLRMGVTAREEMQKHRRTCVKGVRFKSMAQWDEPELAEQEVHVRFRQYHSHGEWFRLEGDLAAFVQEHSVE